MGLFLSTSRSSAILASTTLVCWSNLKTPPAPKILHLTFASIAFTSFFAVERCNNEHDKNAKRAYKQALYFQTFFALPSFTTALWLASGFGPLVAWSWTLVQVFPFVYYMKKRFDHEMDELINEIALTPALAVSLSEENYFGAACAMAYEIGRFCLKYGEAFDLPHVGISNCFQCVFVLLLAKAVDK